MKIILKTLAILTSLFFISIAQAYDGKVVESKNKQPISEATVTLGSQAVKTDAEGKFHIDGSGDTLKFRAPGFERKEVPVTDMQNGKTEVALDSHIVKALYLSTYGVTSSKIRKAALESIKNNNLNALVIDVKSDRGQIAFKVDIPLANQIGAQNLILVKDMPGLIADLKKEGLYLIARIVVFKDDPLATAKPEWAVRRNGQIFKDGENLHWVDPFNKQVWAYNIDIAKAAAEAGFDEIQFDYVRCPDKKGMQFSKPSTKENRSEAITGFLTAAHQALVPYNVMVAADIFGYVPWNTDDTGIGQEIDKVASAVDIISPMLYPSGFQFGIPDYRNPIKNPYEVIYLSLKKAQNRTNISPLRFRPWLQAFRDYAFRGGDFGEERMLTQIKAADKFGASGYMFWNPRNSYPVSKFTQ